MKAMILAAGKGTRLQPLTNSKPKALVEIGGVTMLEHQINYLKYYGVNEMIINIHHFGEQIEEFIRQKKFGCRIGFSDERDELLETGGGLKKASWFFNDGKPFFLIGSDIYTDLNLGDMMSFHRKFNPVATLAVKKRQTTRELLIDKENFICGWQNNQTSEKIISRENRAPLQGYGFSVVHIIDPVIFENMTETGAFSLIPFYLRISKDHPVRAFIHNENDWLEFGRLQNLDDELLLERAIKIIRKYQPLPDK